MDPPRKAPSPEDMPSGDYRSSAAGGSAQGPSSRLTVACSLVSSHYPGMRGNSRQILHHPCKVFLFLKSFELFCKNGTEKSS